MLQIIQKRKYAYWFSGILTIASVAILIVWGLRLGIDFKGGTLMEVRFAKDPAPQAVEVTEALSGIDLRSLTAQPTEGNGILLRYLASDENTNDAGLGKLKEIDPEVALLRTDFIGASVSDQIKRNAFTGIFLSVFAIAAYIAWAFSRVSRPISSWEYGIGAVIALSHDILVVIGLFVLLGRFYDIEVGVPFVAALLTILGYSVNDTIVVYDRIRENLQRSAIGKEDFEITVNRSINETLGRSINTSLTVIIVLVAVTVFGGESIRWFGAALLAGVFFGTYSSVYIASALIVTRYKMKEISKQ
ncbi:MAG: Protein-export rane protein SecF [Patescibacteria group bacterium]|nr:Protein-export rane protein SecF [Patescibacteria group bacterium]